MKKNFLIKGSVSLLAASSLSACNGMHTPEYSAVKEKANNRVEVGFEEQKDALIPKKSANSEIIDDFYVDKNSIDITTGVNANLPIIFDKEISFIQDGEVAMKDILLDLYNLTGLNVDFQYDTPPSTTGTEDTSSVGVVPEVATEMPTLDANGNPVVETGNTSEEVDNSVKDGIVTPESTIPVNFSGKLSDLLSYISAKTNFKWKYDSVSEKIFFYKYNTKTFQLYSVAEKFNMSTQINTSAISSNEEGGSSGGNSQNIEFSSSGNSFDSIVKAIKIMVSEKGKVSYNESLASITVTDTDFILSEIEKYVDDLNKDASKQVVFQLQIFNVKLNDSSNLGVNWQLVNKDLSKFASPLNGVSATTNFGRTMVPGTAEFSAAFSTNSGSSYMLGLLNEVGSVSSVSNFSVVTLNNQPVPIQIAQNVTYIKDVEVIPGENGSPPTSSATSAEVKESVSMIATPKVIGQNIILQYAIGLSVIDRIEKGDNGVEKPVTSTKQVVQKVIVKNGQSTVVGAFEKVDDKTANSGPVDADMWMLGGHEEYSNSKEVMVIVVTPYVTNTKTDK